MQVLLISTYELGRQPFGIASPAAWLRRDGHEVSVADLSLECLPQQKIREADFIAFHLPMHTATRLAASAIGKVKAINPAARLCCYGLYAPPNEEYLRELGVEYILGGEFEAGLTEAVRGGRPPLVSLERLTFLEPDRSGLPVLNRYSQLHVGGAKKKAAYTEASRGCKHLCRHCPIVPVYKGAFRVVAGETVLADVRQQIAAGATHVTFGDPDFFNGPSHAMRIVQALHAEFPGITYDATIKIEHLRKHRDLLPRLKATGCLFLTTAVESFDDRVLDKLAKGHTRADFIGALEDCRALGLSLSPTFVAFTPWTTIQSYREMLACMVDLDLIEQVAPVQLALRLLIPPGSLLLELSDVRDRITAFDGPALLHRWRHEDPAVDELAAMVMKTAQQQLARGEIFRQVWEIAYGAPFDGPIRGELAPYMDEPWYCCAEPTEEQVARL